jgi:hypothetical protein
MPTDPTLVISIDRSDMVGAPAALTFSATPAAGEYGITEYTEPIVAPANIYATPSDYEDGERIRGARWQNTILSWDFVTDEAATEQESRNLIADVRAAISRLRYVVTVTADGATGEGWVVQGYGTLSPNGSRTRANLLDHDPIWGLSLPVHPTRSL